MTPEGTDEAATATISCPPGPYTSYPLSDFAVSQAAVSAMLLECVANTTDIDCALQQLKEVSALIGKTCKPLDLVAIKKAMQKADEKKNISRMVLISLIVLIICAIIMYLS